jgi:uncharacterized protein
MSESRVVDRHDASRFEIVVDGRVAGYAEYTRANSTLSLTHTLVEPEYEGHGLGSELAHGVLEAARRGGLSVLPFCPFIRGYIQRHSVYIGLVPAGRRAGFGLESPPPA